ncbi:hypothetical protein OG474_16060 [Kribbella sp. NBC_01505]|uniref:hypothetical protein n=1 Tax=Kribbella sp. NBC_01505 TaxID=2903580 RepID=UPI0038669C62
MRNYKEMTVVQFRTDGWRAVAAIDGRDYPDDEAYERAVQEAFERVNIMEVPAQFVRREVTADERRSPLPTWAEYFGTRTEARARELLAEYHNAGLPAEFPRYTADAFTAYQVTPYEDWLIFTVESGFTNQTFLVSDPMVYESPGWQS